MAQGKRLVRRDAGSGRLVVHAPDRAGATFIRTTPASSTSPVFDLHARPLDDLRADVRSLAAKRSIGVPREHDRAQARGADRRGAVKRAALVVAGVAASLFVAGRGRRVRPLHVGQRHDVQVAAELRADHDLPGRLSST